MSELDYLRAVLLGAIQGITEFLPVSSSAHLAITQRWLGLDADSPPLLLFDVLAHLGTLVAVLIVFARSGGRFISRLAKELRPGGWGTPGGPSLQRWGTEVGDANHSPTSKDMGHPSTSEDMGHPSLQSAIRNPKSAIPGGRYALRIALLAVAATIPTAVIGLAFKDTFESAFGKPRWIGAALIITGGLLAAMKVLPRAKRGWKDFRWWQAVLVGIAQAGAIMPGISRSGSTICIASYFGLRRRWAAEFSFLIAVPAIVGAALVKLKDTLELPRAVFETIPIGPLVVGSAVALLTGVLALIILLNAVRRAKLHYFAPYCWLLGALLVCGALD